MTPRLLSPGRLAAGAALALGVAAVVWYLGGSAWHAAGLGLLAAAAAAVWGTLPESASDPWPPDEPIAPTGGRDQVMVLGWAMRPQHGRLRPHALQRLRQIAQLRLSRRGLDLDAASDRDAVVGLLGDEAYAVLRSSVGSMPRSAAYLRCVDAVARLEEDP